MNAFAHPLPQQFWPERRAHARLTSGVAVPQRRVSSPGELRIYLHHRRAAWRSIVLALFLAGGSLGLWVALVAHLG